MSPNQSPSKNVAWDIGGEKSLEEKSSIFGPKILEINSKFDTIKYSEPSTPFKLRYITPHKYNRTALFDRLGEPKKEYIPETVYKHGDLRGLISVDFEDAVGS